MPHDRMKSAENNGLVNRAVHDILDGPFVFLENFFEAWHIFLFASLVSFRRQVYDNEFVSTMAGAINVQRLPQGKICDNSCEDGRCEVVG